MSYFADRWKSSLGVLGGMTLAVTWAASAPAADSSKPRSMFSPSPMLSPNPLLHPPAKRPSTIGSQNADSARKSRPPARPAEIRVFPPDVQLTTSRDRQSLVVQARYPDGLTRDVTDEAKFTLANPALARLQKALLTPLADGSTKLSVEW